jgi:putative pyruvate formate lyase activating enzyme
MLRLEDEGAHNINLVTPSHYTEAITEALAAARLKIPAVYNTSGYDDVGALKKISPYISIWLTDFKYVNPDTAARYSGCADYPAVAAEAIRYMLSRGAPVIGADGLMRSGVIIRHLVLPALRKESIAAVEYLHNNFGNAYLLSLMAQYTVVPECACRELRRRLTTYEYNSVADVARRLGTKGFIQDITAAGAEYIPDFGGKTGC